MNWIRRTKKPSAMPAPTAIIHCAYIIFFNNWFDRYLPKHRFIVENFESPAAVYCGLMKYNGLLRIRN